MPDLLQLLVTLGTAVLPLLIQLMLSICALVGMISIAHALLDFYRMLQEDYRRPSRENRPLSILARCIIGGLMTIPSVVLWRASDVFVRGAATTNNTVLAYIGEAPPTGYCDRFVMVLHLTFVFVGCLSIYIAAINAIDKVTGFNPNGGRAALRYFFGGLLCVVIVDVVEIAANTIGIDLGFPQICVALGSP
jgi:hypothetical protein